MSAPSQDEIAALKAKYGDELRKLSWGDDVVIVRTPTRGDYKRFMQSAVVEKNRPSAMEELAYICTVYPGRDAFEALLERKPAIYTKIANAAVELGGADEGVEAEKLLVPFGPQKRATGQGPRRYSLSDEVTTRPRRSRAP